jgi:hypothetical protein
VGDPGDGLSGAGAGGVGVAEGGVGFEGGFGERCRSGKWEEIDKCDEGGAYDGRHAQGRCCGYQSLMGHGTERIAMEAHSYSRQKTSYMS